SPLRLDDRQGRRAFRLRIWLSLHPSNKKSRRQRGGNSRAAHEIARPSSGLASILLGTMDRRGSLVGGLAVGLLAAALAGCGSSGKRTVTPASVSDEGAKVYLQAGCGSCHTLAAAKSGGQIGPNLD